MKRFARALAVTLGLVVLGSFVFLVPQKNASGTASGAPVTITNTPLPVTGSVNATVSGTVNVGNFPAMQNVSITNASVPVTGSLGVSGSVGISNTPSSPVPMLNVDEPTAQPFLQRFCFSSIAGQCAGEIGSPTNGFQVPSTTAGGASVKRLVVEFVSGQCVVPNGNQIGGIALGGVGEQPPSHVFGLTYAPGTTQAETFGQQTKIYYDPGEFIVMSPTFFITIGSVYQCDGTISGYLATQ
jgi:hypothetical protein